MSIVIHNSRFDPLKWDKKKRASEVKALLEV
jgi:hypothetical protein